MENTRYFHSVVKWRRISNRILKIKGNDGNWIENYEEVEQFIRNYFQHSCLNPNDLEEDFIIKELESLPIPQVTEEQAFSLYQPFTESEITTIVLQLKAFKASDPDGIPAEFFHKFVTL